MYTNEIKTYQTLNELAQPAGWVVFGGSEDKAIPLCELKQAFELDSNLYNRSITDLSIFNASKVFDACIADLTPESLFLHIGAADLHTFSENPAHFDQAYRELIQHIRSSVFNCRLAIVSLKNPTDDPAIASMNQHLKVLAESEQCEYFDIASKRVWNPKETKDVMSFVHSLGFVRPLREKRPLFDLVKILFCYEPSYTV